MRIVADQNIPLLDQFFATNLNLIRLPTTEINGSSLKDVDVLICRSVTRINAALLAGTTVKLVATASSGTDHFDKKWLAENDILTRSACGCNAQSVAEYVVSVVAQLQTQGHPLGKRAGVIGVGHVGSQVVKKLKQLGFSVLMNDPPRAAQEGDFHSVPLEQFRDLDLISLHVPLTRSGDYPTYHFIDEQFLRAQKANTVLINTARGAVIDTKILKKYGKQLIWCLDVYESEPNIDAALIQSSQIATPHIAGHAVQAKWRAAQIVYQDVMAYLSLPVDTKLPHPIPPPKIQLADKQHSWQEIVLKIYDPTIDTETLRLKTQEPNVTIAQTFTFLRNNYRVRHEFNYPQLYGGTMSTSDEQLIHQLGINWKPNPKHCA